MGPPASLERLQAAQERSRGTAVPPRTFAAMAVDDLAREACSAVLVIAYSFAAFLTSAATICSSAGVSSVTAKAVGHMVPSSSCAASKNARLP